MNRISRFSPNWSNPEDLEAITVAREGLIANAVEGIRQSALTKNKHHYLFIGPRGSGKTHLVTLVRHRLSQMDDLAPKLRIAWLNEDETSDSLLSLLLRIHRALAREYPGEFPPASAEPVFDLTGRAEATEAITVLLLEQLGEKTLLVLVENLDALFHDFAEGEAKRWRALIQNHPQFCTVATAQRLFHGVSDREAPFFGFFQVEQLRPFTVSDAAELLARIAARRKDPELAAFVSSPLGRARLRALHHLTGGNQRLFIILSEFIDPESLDSLVGPFEELIDEQLTPYYQERLRWLPTLQRRIVEFLCTVSKPQTVKSIARQLFTTSQSISSQLQDLRRIGYLESRKRGRESFYELAEPLMRLSHQVKEAQGRAPLRFLVDFLRVWYDHAELDSRLKSLAADAPLSRQYFSEALSLWQREGNLRLQYLSEDAHRIDLASCDEEQLELLRDLKEESGVPNDALYYGVALGHAGHHEKARDVFTETIKMEAASAEVVAVALISRALMFGQLGDSKAALFNFTEVIEGEDTPAEQLRWALVGRGLIYGHLGNPEAAIADYTAVIGMPDAPLEPIAMALVNRGATRGELGEFEAVIADFTDVIEMPDAPAEQVIWALFDRGVAHGRLGNFEAGIADYTVVIDMPDAPAEDIAKALVNRGAMYGDDGDSEAAIADFATVIEMTDAPAEQIAKALFNRGVAHQSLGDSESAIADYTALIEMNAAPATQLCKALVNRGVTHGQLGNLESAIADFTAVVEMELGDNSSQSCAHFGLADILASKDWNEALRHLRSGFSLIDDVTSDYVGDLSRFISAIHQFGQSAEVWQPKANALLALYAEHGAVNRLATGLVHSIRSLQDSALSPAGLDAWHALWAERAETYPELALPARLLRTGIDYFVSGGDQSVLLDLPSEERRILEQALGLAGARTDGKETLARGLLRERHAAQQHR